jgi:hypothetical protein
VEVIRMANGGERRERRRKPQALWASNWCEKLEGISLGDLVICSEIRGFESHLKYELRARQAIHPLLKDINGEPFTLQYLARATCDFQLHKTIDRLYVAVEIVPKGKRMKVRI